MKTPLGWITEYTKIVLPKEELISKIFTQIGAIETIEEQEEKYKGIVFAKIEDKKEHPDSDRLCIYKVNTGDKVVQVVAGDKDIKVGNIVAYLPIGTKVPFNTHPDKWNGVISKAILRGVESEGMLASERELDLGIDHTKVMVFEGEYTPGELISEKLQLNDSILDIENKALANRSDCFGILGLAREISAIQGLKFDTPSWYLNDPKFSEGKDIKLKVINETKTNCPRFMAIAMNNIKIEQSPLWLRILLIKVGIRPINNVVDITNYIMALTGQPMHAFDYDKVKAKDNNDITTIVVRQAKNGEVITGLNDKEVILDETMTVVCDSKSPISIAGIIGGKDTQIDENTKTIILECANFNRYNIRKTSWKIGVFTDAMTRFTKDLNAIHCDRVLAKSIELIQELANGKVASNLCDSYEEKRKNKSIVLDIDLVNDRIGVSLSKGEIHKILKSLEYEIVGDEVTPPFWRTDIEIPEDVIEDISRVYGFSNIPITLPKREITPVLDNRDVNFKNKIRNTLKQEGANEIYTYNFVSDTLNKKCNIDINDLYHIKNSLSPELEYMRLSLIPSLIEKAVENIERGYSDISLYEINIAHNNKEVGDDGLPIERWYLSGIVSKTEGSTNNPYYFSKVYVEELRKDIGLKEFKYELLKEAKDIPTWVELRREVLNENSSALVSYFEGDKKYVIGVIGELKNNVKKAFKLPNNTSVYELDIEMLKNSTDVHNHYQEPSKFPKVIQDICIQVLPSVPYDPIRSEICNILKKSKYNYEIELLDIYQPDEEEIKRYTFRISIQSKENTLDTSHFDDLKRKIEEKIKEIFDGIII